MAAHVFRKWSLPSGTCIVTYIGMEPVVRIRTKNSFNNVWSEVFLDSEQFTKFSSRLYGIKLQIQSLDSLTSFGQGIWDSEKIDICVKDTKILRVRFDKGVNVMVQLVWEDVNDIDNCEGIYLTLDDIVDLNKCKNFVNAHLKNLKEEVTSVNTILQNI